MIKSESRAIPGIVRAEAYARTLRKRQAAAPTPDVAAAYAARAVQAEQAVARYQDRRDAA